MAACICMLQTPISRWIRGINPTDWVSFSMPNLDYETLTWISTIRTDIEKKSILRSSWIELKTMLTMIGYNKTQLAWKTFCLIQANESWGVLMNAGPPALPPRGQRNESLRPHTLASHLPVFTPLTSLRRKWRDPGSGGKSVCVGDNKLGCVDACGMRWDCAPLRGKWFPILP